MVRFRARPASMLTLGCALGISTTSFAQTAESNEQTPVEEPPSANADTRAPSGFRDSAAAEVLFRFGRQLLRASKPEEALAKFEESYRLDPTAGALYNQAECRLMQGKTASAWALYQQAATLADLQGKPDIYELATSRANRVSAELSYITFHVGAPVPGLQVLRDGVLVGRAQFDVTLPIDPGRHSISARAPGYEPLEMFIIVGEKHDRKNVAIPRLKLKPLPPPPEPPPPPKPPEPVVVPKPNPGPWLLGGAGAASLLLGSVAGILALQENSNMKEVCPAQIDCPPWTSTAQGRRDFESKLSWVTIPVGLIAIGSSITWGVLTRQPEQPRSAHRSPTVEVATGAHAISCMLAEAF